MTTVSRVSILIVLASLGAGCAHDLPGWKQASTEHFQLYTDLSRRHYEPTLQHLEEVHAGLTSSFFGDTAVPPVEVFLLAAHEFEELLGPIGGMFLRRPDRSGILVVREGWDPHFLDRTAAHELAHAFIGATFRSPPIWFNEGFSTYAESIVVRDGKVWFGSVAVRPEASGGRLVPVTELFAAPARDFHGAWETRHYSTGWAIIHYLWHGEDKQLRKRFDAFGAALAQQGKDAAGSSRAWAQVYPEIPLDQLDGRLRDHLARAFALPKSSMVGFAMRAPPPTELRLEPARMAYVDEVRALLRKFRRPDRY